MCNKKKLNVWAKIHSSLLSSGGSEGAKSYVSGFEWRKQRFSFLLLSCYCHVGWVSTRLDQKSWVSPVQDRDRTVAIHAYICPYMCVYVSVYVCIDKSIVKWTNNVWFNLEKLPLIITLSLFFVVILKQQKKRVTAAVTWHEQRLYYNTRLVLSLGRATTSCGPWDVVSAHRTCHTRTCDSLRMDGALGFNHTNPFKWTDTLEWNHSKLQHQTACFLSGFKEEKVQIQSDSQLPGAHTPSAWGCPVHFEPFDCRVIQIYAAACHNRKGTWGCQGVGGGWGVGGSEWVRSALISKTAALSIDFSELWRLKASFSLDD